MDYLSYGLILAGVIAVYAALVSLLRKAPAQDRLNAAQARGDFFRTGDEGVPALASLCESAVRLTGLSDEKQKETTLFLSQAGIYSPYASAYYLFFQRFIQPLFLLAGLFALFTFITKLAVLPALSKILYLLLAALLSTIGLYGARLAIINKKQRRQKILIRAFPEMLDLLLVCIESGLGLDASLNRVCNEMRATHPEIISELDRTRGQLTVIGDRTQVLQSLAERMDIVQFKSLVAALLQSEKFGTSLLETLRVLSDDLRNRRLMDAENKAARLPVLITIPLIFCMMPAFVMIILGPPIVRVIEQGGIFGHKTVQD